MGGDRSSTPGSSTMTPTQQGFSMFGGKAFSTPASGGPRPRPPSLDLSTQTDGTPVGSGVPRQGGISRFKTLTQQTPQHQEQEEEIEEHEEEEDTKFHRSGSRHPARALLLPSAELSRHAAMMGSPLMPSQVASPSPFRTSIGGSFGHGYSTPAPADPTASSPAVAGGGDTTTAVTMTMTGPGSRKRPRPQQTATTTSRTAPQLTTTTTPAAAERAGAARKPSMGGNPQRDAQAAFASQARQERTWGSIDRQGDAQHENRKSPRPAVAARGGAGAGGVARGRGTPKSSSRSPRAKAKSPSQSPRAGRGGSSQPLSQGPAPPPRRYTLADFAGADEVCFNAGEGETRSRNVRQVPRVYSVHFLCWGRKRDTGIRK